MLIWFIPPRCSSIDTAASRSRKAAAAVDIGDTPPVMAGAMELGAALNGGVAAGGVVKVSLVGGVWAEAGNANWNRKYITSVGFIQKRGRG
jgi:hypothetical protein